MIKPYFQKDDMTIYCGDCLEIMPELESVDLVLTDPPYGRGSKRIMDLAFDGKAVHRDYEFGDWNEKPIENNDLLKLLSCGDYACCFGGNYYLISPSSCWLVWDKENGKNKWADCELAWTNYPGSVRLKRHKWQGMLRKHNEVRYHPTQKPLDVIKWAMQLAPKYDIVADPFMGSGTTLVAAKQLNRKAIGIEIEEKYCEIAAKRIESAIRLDRMSFHLDGKEERKTLDL